METPLETINKTYAVAQGMLLEKTRKNFSKQADEVIKKLASGQVLRDSDYFILFNTDQKQIDEAIMLDDIKDRINKGRIQHSDIDFLVEILGDVGGLENALKNSFYIKADQINLAYANAHPNEFTAEEVLELQQRLEGKSLKETIKNELNKIV